MDNSVRLHSQVAAMAGVSAEKALMATYLLSLSRAGKTIDQAANLCRLDRADVRDVARDWGISFTDYTPSAKPLLLVWSKIKRGRWELRLNDGTSVATLESDGEGSYRSFYDAEPVTMADNGSSALVAARRLSQRIDRRSVGLFGVDDIAINFRNTDGSVERLAPVAAEDPRKLQLALHA